MKFNEIPVSLLKEWDYIKNLEELKEVPMSFKFWWICNKGHNFKATLSNRISNKTGCPFCSGRKATLENCLAKTHPILSKEWHLVKNRGITPFDVKRGTKLKFWWTCNKGHEWESSPKLRTLQNQNCPYCSGKRPSKEYCLETTHPELLKEWNFKLNKLLPNQVTPGSSKYVWWICKKKHSYKMTINNKVNRKDNCPYCSNKRVSFDNCLNTLYPEISKEWHPIKNNNKTPKDFMRGSAKKVWWLCKKGHEFKSAISSRTSNKSNCPYCYYKTEQKVREIFEKMFKKKFPKKRPSWLINPTGGRLELDGYNKKLKLAFEYDGEWHDQPHPRTKDYNEFLKILDNDKIKNRLCFNRGITLIRIHHSKKFNLKKEIINKLKKFKVNT